MPAIAIWARHLIFAVFGAAAAWLLLGNPDTIAGVYADLMPASHSPAPEFSVPDEVLHPDLSKATSGWEAEAMLRESHKAQSELTAAHLDERNYGWLDYQKWTQEELDVARKKAEEELIALRAITEKRKTEVAVLDMALRKETDEGKKAQITADLEKAKKAAMEAKNAEKVPNRKLWMMPRYAVTQAQLARYAKEHGIERAPDYYPGYIKSRDQLHAANSLGGESPLSGTKLPQPSGQKNWIFAASGAFLGLLLSVIFSKARAVIRRKGRPPRDQGGRAPETIGVTGEQP